MSRIKVSKTATTATIERPSKEWPAVVYFWAIGLAFISYVIARVALDGMPHPYHWASAVVGGVVGIGIGWLWYRWRGDIFQ